MLHRALPMLLVATLLGAHPIRIAAAQARASRPAGSARKAPFRATGSSASAGEQRAEARFQKARAAGELPLHAFLEQMPKGGDLHMHLSGAVYAETFLKDAADDNLCVDPVRLILDKRSREADAPPVGQPGCGPGQVPASAAFKDQKLYDALIDSFSMRAFVPSSGRDGHDQFFATFGRFSGIAASHHGEWLDELATRAAAQNVQYLEVMETPAFSHAAALGYAAGWPSETPPETSAASSSPLPVAGASTAELARLRDRLLAAGLRDEVTVDRAEFASALAERKRREHCDISAAAAACSVQIRFLYQVLRAFPPQQVFAQTLLAFEVAAADPDVVGINFVQPEDAYLAMSEYSRQMLMLDYLHAVYPAVHISLHAGELAPGLVPPAGLRFHIREAVELGHAERIGHGVDVLYETDSAGLLREMSMRHIMVEINLTSNDVILGVGPNRHSLPEYLAAHVPVALSTDDEGVSRIDLSHEYVRAALDFHLDYLALKQMARTSLEHAFLPGHDLWSMPDDFTTLAAPCRAQPSGADRLERECARFLASSPRARQQWELERRFRNFESESHP